MIRKYIFVAALTLGLATTQANVVIDETTFPDDTFRGYIMEKYGADGILDDEEIAGTVEMSLKDVENAGEIVSLKGIEHFTELETLDCSCCALTKLDVSLNRKLVELNCSGNRLTAFDPSYCQSLMTLDISCNAISGQAMSFMAFHMPPRPGYNMGTLRAINQNDPGRAEENRLTEAQVTMAKSRGWVSYDKAANGEWTEYAGEPTKTEMPDSIYIEDFSIKPGDSRLVDVWMDSSTPWMNLYNGKIVLPEGLEFVALTPEEIDSELYLYDKNEFTEYFALSTNFTNYDLMSGPFAGDFAMGGLKTSHYIWYKDKTAQSITFVMPTYTKIEIMGNGQYQLFQFKVQASTDFRGGEIEVCPEGFEFDTYYEFFDHTGSTSSSEVSLGGQPSRARVLVGTVAVEDVKVTPAAAADSRLYDLQGRVVTGTPAPGIYVKQGKKVVVE